MLDTLFRLWYNGRAMDDELKKEWFLWLCGHWVKEPPQYPGTYAVATLDGQACPSETVVIYEQGGEYRCSKDWGGYFWSLPTPPMPLAPRGF